MTQDARLQKIRQRLELELARLQGQVEGQGRETEQRNGENLDRDDLAHNFAQRERRLALRDVEQAQVAQIKEALERLDQGTYGICTNCGRAIAPERLEIIPYATLCIRCQQEQED